MLGIEKSAKKKLKLNTTIFPETEICTHIELYFPIFQTQKLIAGRT